MAAALMTSVEQYLNTTYRPDCDYIDGAVLERNTGEKPHGRMQREIMAFLCRTYPAIEELLFPAQRVEVKSNRFRVPDVCVLRREDASEPAIVRTPPLLCIEVLSQEESLTDISRRLDDYLEMGVDVCWVVDPLGREGWTATQAGQLVRASDGILRAPGIEMPLVAVLPAIE